MGVQVDTLRPGDGEDFYQSSGLLTEVRLIFYHRYVFNRRFYPFQDGLFRREGGR